MLENHFEKIQALYKKTFGELPYECYLLPPSGSYRRYYRLKGKVTCIGVNNADIKENNAFISFTKGFKKINLPVPAVLATSEDNQLYLLDDLGDKTLFEYVKHETNTELIKSVYKKVIDNLLLFQFSGKDVIDFSTCYPREKFDAQSVRWDLNYFKYNFVKLLQIGFDEQLLEDDFNELISYMETFEPEFFLYRDFQSSNIMLVDGAPFFIDYQGGRKGSFFYDLASLLYDAKANLGNDVRNELKQYYYTGLKGYYSIDQESFEYGLNVFSLVRIMQAMGAYGFRGLYEKKSQFIVSIPLAVQNLKNLIQHIKLPFEAPALFHVFNQIVSHPLSVQNAHHEQFIIRINSFSYRKSIPMDYSGNGGGFVFDCRGLPNPGRYSEYKSLTGKDAEVIAFFKDKDEVHSFLEHVKELIDICVKDYLNRKRTDLQINFGCTGGQHRSVYCAENLAEHLQKYNVTIELKHLEQDAV